MATGVNPYILNWTKKVPLCWNADHGAKRGFFAAITSIVRSPLRIFPLAHFVIKYINDAGISNGSKLVSLELHQATQIHLS